MNTKIFVGMLLFGSLLLSCEDNLPLVSESSNSNNNTILKNGYNNAEISVMTRNIYVGTDVDKILLTENHEEIPLIVTELKQMLEATNFPERALALAKEIYVNQPHLIGLQEVSLFRIQSPGDAAFGGTTPAEEIIFNFLEILMEAISSYGLEYEVAAKIKNADVEMPMFIGSETEFDDLRLTDYDVILAKRGIPISKVVEKNYNARVIVEDLGLELPCGYVAVTAEVNGKPFRFVNTHLQDIDQSEELAMIQKLQTNELMRSLSKTLIPVILVGDFNSSAPNGLTYQTITDRNGYTDVWLKNCLTDNPSGLTYGHDLDLRNATQNFWERIDYVFVKCGKGKHKLVKLKKVFASVLGDEVQDKTPSGLWPSDHGGVLANLKFK